MANQFHDRVVPAAAEGTSPQSLPIQRSNYLVRHWRGEVSLPRSFWLNLVGVNFCFTILSSIAAFGLRITSLLGSAVFIVCYWILALAMTVWQFVGVWRAARIYSGQKSHANLARAVIILFVCMSLVGLYRTIVPQLAEAFSIVSGDSALDDYQVTVLPSGREIEFKGGIKLGAAKRVQQVLDAAPYVTTFRIDSWGGRFAEALEIAELVRHRQLDTYVPNTCASAGVFIFLAGKGRVIRRSAKIGFHSISFPGIPASDANKLPEDAYRKAGLSEKFIKRASRTAANDFWFPTADELIAERVATRVTAGYEYGFGTENLAKYDTARLRQELVEEPMYSALARVKPSEFNNAVEAVMQEIRQGGSFASASHRVNSLLLSTAAEMWPTASDAVLDGWLDLMIKLVADNMEKTPREVLMKVNNHPDALAWGAQAKDKLPNYPQDDEHRLLAALFDGGRVETTTVRLETATVEMQELFARTFPIEEEQQLLLGGIPDTMEKCKRACSLYLRFYHAIKSLPPEKRADVERVLMTGK